MLCDFHFQLLQLILHSCELAKGHNVQGIGTIYFPIKGLDCKNSNLLADPPTILDKSGPNAEVAYCLCWETESNPGQLGIYGTSVASIPIPSRHRTCYVCVQLIAHYGPICAMLGVSTTEHRLSTAAKIDTENRSHNYCALCGPENGLGSVRFGSVRFGY